MKPIFAKFGSIFRLQILKLLGALMNPNRFLDKIEIEKKIGNNKFFLYSDMFIVDL